MLSLLLRCGYVLGPFYSYYQLGRCCSFLGRTIQQVPRLPGLHFEIQTPADAASQQQAPKTQAHLAYLNAGSSAITFSLLFQILFSPLLFPLINQTRVRWGLGGERAFSLLSQAQGHWGRASLLEPSTVGVLGTLSARAPAQLASLPIRMLAFLPDFWGVF